MMPTRDEVFDVINGERAYQDSMPPERTDHHVHGVTEELVLIEVYRLRACCEWTDVTDPEGIEAALHGMRKIAAICVRCMEHHGAPPRVR